MQGADGGELPAAKNTPGLEFLKETHSQVLQQAMKSLDRAFKDAFDKKQPGKRFPRFKKRGQQDSFRYPQGIKASRHQVNKATRQQQQDLS